jgi:hypothetical protein
MLSHDDLELGGCKITQAARRGAHHPGGWHPPPTFVNEDQLLRTGTTEGALPTTMRLGVHTAGGTSCGFEFPLAFLG